MNTREQEKTAIEKLRNDYEADGYETLLENRKYSVGSYIPDLVVRKDGKITLIEVKGRRSPSVVSTLEKLKNHIEKVTPYEFQVFFLNNIDLPHGPKVQLNKEIDAVLIEVEQASTSGQKRAAFLASWAAFEAASRRVFQNRFVRPQTPNRLISVLSEEGILTPSQAGEMRNLAQKRNKLIHGELDVSVAQEEISTMIKRIREIQHYTSPPKKI